ncbi:unnamed protein product [Symbiodinium sp. CCMP2456]|nr:unnamed protein product [Symbiodinium sp. CCMP2456]
MLFSVLSLPIVFLGLAAQSDLAPLDADDECVDSFAGSCSLTALQTRSQVARGDAPPANVSAGQPGLVYAVYTYGAVAISKTPLADRSTPSGNFRGVRCYSETILSGSLRQTDIAAIFMGLSHPRVPTLALHKKKDSEYWPGAGRPDLPKHVDQGRTANIALHDMKNYIERLAHLQLHGQNVAQNKPFNFAHHFAYLAWGAYEKQKSWVTGQDVTMEQIIAHDVPGWNLVAQTQQDTLEAVDNIWLVQNTESLDCVIAFEGTHSFQEFFGNLKGEEKEKGYCGLPGVHTGYADKLYWLMKYSMPKLRPNLAKCNKVSCTGHSLGGSLCEVGCPARCLSHGAVRQRKGCHCTQNLLTKVFAACANSGHIHDNHYKARADMAQREKATRAR